MVKQYQVVVDPLRLRGYGISLMMVEEAIRSGNQEIGGSVIEMAEAEYMVRATGYIKSIGDLENIPVMTSADGTPVLLGDVAEVRLGPEMRRGIGELDGEGEAVGGVIVMRNGENARDTIERVKAKLDELRAGLPEGVEIVETYDRSTLIQRAIDNLQRQAARRVPRRRAGLLPFLFHLRSGLIVVIVTPIAVASAFIVMRAQGINANIMSLGGIAIAIGTLVDAAIVMIENVHKKLEHQPDESRRMEAIYAGCREVGPSLFFSLMIVALSFLPVFTLEAQEGRLFAPLAYTKTYAMVAAVAAVGHAGAGADLATSCAGASAPSTPIRSTARLLRSIEPFLDAGAAPSPARDRGRRCWCWRRCGRPSRLGSEFMPELDEGDLLYMPTTYRACRPTRRGAAAADRPPDPDRARGGARVRQGRARRDRHRPGADRDVRDHDHAQAARRVAPRHDARKLKAELDALVKLPGLTNAWVIPDQDAHRHARHRHPHAGRHQDRGPGPAGDRGARPAGRGGAPACTARRRPTPSACHRALHRHPHRPRSGGAHWLGVEEIQDVISTAVGGMNVAETVEGRERYPINLRYPAEYRDSVERLRALPIVTERELQLELHDVARVTIKDGPDMIRSEDARLNGWTYIDIQGRDLGSYIAAARGRGRAGEAAAGLLAQLVRTIRVPAARASGSLDRAAHAGAHRADAVAHFPPRRASGADAGGAAAGARRRGVAHWLLGYELSVATAVGFIALAGVATEFGVVMLVYLDHLAAPCAAAGARQPPRRRCARR